MNQAMGERKYFFFSLKFVAPLFQLRENYLYINSLP